MQETVDHQGAGRLVHLVFDRLAADRHLDDDVHVIGRIMADGNRVDAHGMLRGVAPGGRDATIPDRSRMTSIGGPVTLR